MTQTKEIVKRIKSVKNTKKITRAMEMVAAARMRKAVELVTESRSYADLSWEVIQNISDNLGKDINHPLLEVRKKVKNIGLILISSNKGLCGGFNSAIIQKAREEIEKNVNKNVNIEFILVGKKGISIRNRYDYKIEAEFKKADTSPKITETRAISKLIMDNFLEKKYDRIILIYTDFISAAKQVTRAKQILPIDIKDENYDENLGNTNKNKDKNKKELNSEMIFEPSPEKILNDILPRLIEVQIYQAILESNASEHSARMQAMHQATESAGDLIYDLTLSYNKARQAAITAEIAEIAAGAEALNK